MHENLLAIRTLSSTQSEELTALLQTPELVRRLAAPSPQTLPPLSKHRALLLTIQLIFHNSHLAGEYSDASSVLNSQTVHVSGA